jgi:hypothetical protein
VVAVREREAERDRLRRRLAALDRANQAAQFDSRRVEQDLRAKLADWKALLRRRSLARCRP